MKNRDAHRSSPLASADQVSVGAHALSPGATAAASPPNLSEIYERQFPFVFRTMRRLGVPAAQLDDAVQDVFLVVHRRWKDLRWSSAERTLLFGIALRVAKDHRRAMARRKQDAHDTWGGPDVGHELADANAAGPVEAFEEQQARAILHSILDQLDDERRAILISVELEQMPVPEVAQAMGLNLNTTYTKLRSARKQFDEALTRFHANEGGAQGSETKSA